MRKFVCLFAMTFLFCLSAAAQGNSSGDVFAGYSYVRAHPATSGAPSFNLNGGSGSLAWTPGPLGLVGDFGGYHVSKIGSASVDANLFTYLFGPRLTLNRGGGLSPFAQALFGGAHISNATLGGSGTSANTFAAALGAGLDWNASRHFGIRLGQADYLLTRFEEGPNNRKTQNNLRISAGIVFRF